MRRRGFTLIELSIVLVIIGLLIGGILAAKSMISTANILNQVRQIQQFDVAASNFKTKYGGLPGDNTVFNLGIGVNDAGFPGNGNGILEPQLTAGSWHPWNEFSNFWSELSLTQMLNDGHSYTSAGGSGGYVIGGVGVPIAVLSKTSGVGQTHIIALGTVASGKNYYIFEIDPRGVGAMGSGATFTPPMALALDAKMDDALPLTGAVVSKYKFNGLPGDIDLIDDGWINCSITGTNAYNVASSNPSINITDTCQPRIDMFSQVGGNQ